MRCFDRQGFSFEVENFMLDGYCKFSYIVKGINEMARVGLMLVTDNCSASTNVRYLSPLTSRVEEYAKPLVGFSVIR
jgi:hypothetical protein